MAGTFVYVQTTHQKQQNNTSLPIIIFTYLKNFLDSLYWAYYIHLPYYLLNNEDAFLLHSFFLSLFTLAIYAFFAYLPLNVFNLFKRIYYYITGDSF